MSLVLAQVRTLHYLRQIRGGVVYRSIAVGSTFLVIPVLIEQMGSTIYGVWSTLLTIMSWVLLFDLGIGNGLRNKVAEAIANNNRLEAKSYISTAYSTVGFSTVVIWIVAVCVAHLIEWQTVFNTGAIPEDILLDVVVITISSVLINFWIGLVNSLLSAVQETAVVAFGQMVANILVLLLVLFLRMVNDFSIQIVAILYGSALFISNSLLTLYFFKKQSDLIPFVSFKRHDLQPLLCVGVKFFVIQIAVLVIFLTDKIIITQLLGPSFVTEYEVVFKLFGVVTFLHGLLAAPLWSLYTNAYHKGDIAWIRDMLRKQLLILIAFVVLVALIVIFAEEVINIWIGGGVVVNDPLVICMGMFAMIIVWNNTFAMVVNGVGDLRVQIITASTAALVNIPLCVFLVKVANFGTAGVVMGSFGSLLLSGIALPIQVKYLLAK